jgi:octaprenyl-diphosphate synthase
MSSLLTTCDSAVSDQLAEELADVERRFSEELASDLDCVNRLTEHVERYRGKMLRPTLVLLTGMALEPGRRPSRQSQRVLATVAEMVHMATLVHDDILDEAELRRQGATINHLRGNEAAVMLGDYLISHAYHLCSTLERSAVSRAIAAATNRVCEGELLQLDNRHNWDLDERTYFEVIRHKTASFCGSCCQLAGWLSESDPNVAAALYEYGEKLGMAFQIIDDVLDLTGDSHRVGKTLGRDLEKGKLTLPLIRFLATAEPADREWITARLSGPDEAAEEPAQQEAIDWLCRQLVDTDAVTYARGRAGRLVGSAKAVLTGHLPESPARDLLLSMADAVLQRDH